jgi:hypothetical protein
MVEWTLAGEGKLDIWPPPPWNKKSNLKKQRKQQILIRLKNNFKNY